MKAIWNDAVIADSRDTLVVEGNHYFPPEDVDWSRLEPSDTRTECSWKGVAHYFNVVVRGEVNVDAAWTYPHPARKARYIRDYIAFWNGVVVTA